ncbi:MAG: serine hydrolase domain-containing protein [Acidimicrobiales bacterium]
MTQPQGWTAPGWEAVRDAFAQNFAARNEVGAAFSAYHRGEKVVDLWGGVKDETTGEPWEEDTMVVVFSTTKGAVAVCANVLAQREELDVEAPVAKYWPEFAANGKEHVTVDHLLSHRAGLCWVDEDLTAEEVLAWDPIARALANQAPSWEPGTAHGYHTVTYGWLVGEVIRRITGVSMGHALRREVADPLGIDFWIGLPEEHEHRVARLITMEEAINSGRVSFGDPHADGNSSKSSDGGESAYLAALAERALEYMAPDGPLTKSFQVVPRPDEAFASQLMNQRQGHAAEIPAANGIGDARSIACMYSACIADTVTAGGEKIRLLDEAQIADAITQRTVGPDRTLLGLDIQWGLGFMLSRGIIASAGIGGPRGFGHFGMGGSMGWADPDGELSFAYIMNRMDIGTTGDRRAFSLVKACYESL